MIFKPDELRAIGVGGPLWLDMLKSREESIVTRIYSEYKNGKTEFLASVAELVCIRDQIYELTSAIKQNVQQKDPT